MVAAKEAELRDTEESAAHDRNGSTRKVSVKLPASVVKLIEAAETLGIGGDLESFVVDATVEKAESLRQKVRGIAGRENGHRGRRAGGQP